MAPLSGRRLVSALLLAAAALAPARAAAGPKLRTVPVSSLPSWVREEAARPDPPGSPDAVVLLEERVVEPLAAGGHRITWRVVARPLKPSALEDLADWPVRYGKDDRVVGLHGWVLLGDGTAAVPHPKDDVLDVPAVDDIALHTDDHVRLVSLPAVAVGRTVAFEAVVEFAMDPGAELMLFGDEDRPTLLSRLVLRVPPGWSAEPVTARGQALSVTRIDSGVIVEGRDLAPLPREEGRPPADRLLPQAWVRWRSPDGSRGFADWNAVGAWTRELSEPVLADAGEAPVLAGGMKPAAPDGLSAAIEKAFALTARDVRYVAISVGIGGWKPDSPAKTLANRYGDCKAKTYLLRALASTWGLKTYPVLVRTHGMGPVEPEVPTYGQFNHVIAAVEWPEAAGPPPWSSIQVDGVGRLLLLDGTARENRPWDLPVPDQDTLGLLVLDRGARLVRLPVQPSEASAVTRRLAAAVDPQGLLVSGRLEESYEGPSAAFARYRWGDRTPEQRRRERLEYLQLRFPGTALAEYEVSGLDTVDVPVTESMALQGGRAGRKLGTYLVVEPGKVGFGLVRQNLPAAPRPWPLEIGPPAEELLEVALKLPEGWSPESLPEPWKLSLPELEAEGRWAFRDGALAYTRTVRVLVAEVPVDRYAAFREAVLRVRGEDGRGVAVHAGR